MPTTEHLVLCGGLAAPVHAGTRISLNLHGKSANVRLKITDISKRLLVNIPDVLVDLLEVASYIYAADGAISRGSRADAQLGIRWRRRFRFVIPVRLPNLWSTASVMSSLVETLSFLSDDDYEFEFRSFSHFPSPEAYFEFPTADASRFTPDEVILFSGGLDSFAGTIDELAVRGKKVALVSHRSGPKIASAQSHLVDQLRSRFGADRVLHVPVWTTVDGALSKEQTHRSRSFLFAALGTVTARLFGKDRLSIFENGVVSLNLPPVAQVVGARATRTMHPQVLSGVRRLLADLLDHPFDVDNPFIWLTKTDVVERIAANGCSDLIRDTRSCTRVHDMTVLHPHCGRCSQCIDRRFAIIAAKQYAEDPAEAYKVDLMLGEREAGPDREMALSYVRSASNIKRMTDVAFFSHYGETSRIVGFFRESADTVGRRIWDLYRRHSATVCGVFDEAITSHASKLREGNLPRDSLLFLIVSQREGGSVYPIPDSVPGKAAAFGPEIRMAIDPDQNRIVLDRWGELAGVSASLIIALASTFRQAVRNELAPESHPYTETARLMSQTKCDTDETLRRRVMRCRNKIGELAKSAGDPAPSIDDVIENSQWHGYRLNPNRVRIVAASELSGGG